MFDLWNSLYPDMMIYVLQEVIILLSHSMKTETFKDIWAWDGHASWWPMGVTIPWVMPAGGDSLY